VTDGVHLVTLGRLYLGVVEVRIVLYSGRWLVVVVVGRVSSVVRLVVVVEVISSLLVVAVVTVTEVIFVVTVLLCHLMVFHCPAAAAAASHAVLVYRSCVERIAADDADRNDDKQ